MDRDSRGAEPEVEKGLRGWVDGAWIFVSREEMGWTMSIAGCVAPIPASVGPV